jgi:hypothetical protein
MKKINILFFQMLIALQSLKELIALTTASQQQSADPAWSSLMVDPDREEKSFAFITTFSLCTLYNVQYNVQYSTVQRYKSK